jgi:mannose-6-phosphate isomerase
MGTHPKSPSHVRFSGKPLSEHLANNSTLIGKRVIERFDASNGNLPFLFKVLSIEKALSVQSHPDKKTAEVLHAQQPDIYKGVLSNLNLARTVIHNHAFQTRTISQK